MLDFLLLVNKNVKKLKYFRFSVDEKKIIIINYSKSILQGGILQDRRFFRSLQFY